MVPILSSRSNYAREEGDVQGDPDEDSSLPSRDTPGQQAFGKYEKRGQKKSDPGEASRENN